MEGRKLEIKTSQQEKKCTRVKFITNKYTMMITSEQKEDSRSLVVRKEIRN